MNFLDQLETNLFSLIHHASKQIDQDFLFYYMIQWDILNTEFLIFFMACQQNAKFAIHNQDGFHNEALIHCYLWLWHTLITFNINEML